MANDRRVEENKDDGSKKIIEELNELIEEGKKLPVDEPRDPAQGGPGPGH